MAEQIISASGTQHGLIVDSQGRAKTTAEGGIPIEVMNPAYKLEYDSSGNVGSVVQYISNGSYVQVITYAGGNASNIGSWY